MPIKVFGVQIGRRKMINRTLFCVWLLTVGNLLAVNSILYFSPSSKSRIVKIVEKQTQLQAPPLSNIKLKYVALYPIS